MMTNKIKRERIWELDFLRGFAIIMMIFDHFMWDLTYLPGYFSNFYQLDLPGFNWLNETAIWYWNSTLRLFGRYFFVLAFLMVSGVSFTFSKNNFKRGLKMLVVAGLITLVTFILQESIGYRVLIVFGVIHMFAVNTLLTVMIRYMIKNEIVLLFLGMIILTASFMFGFFDPEPVALSWANLPGIVIGLKAYGSDYFGIFPYLGFILIGTVVGHLFYENRISLLPSVHLSKKNIVLFTGRYSLWVYVLHQPLVLVVVMAIGYAFGFRI